MARPTNASGKKKNNVRPASTRPTGFYYVLGAIVLIGASILGYTMMRKPAGAVATDAVTPGQKPGSKPGKSASPSPGGPSSSLAPDEGKSAAERKQAAEEAGLCA